MRYSQIYEDDRLITKEYAEYILAKIKKYIPIIKKDCEKFLQETHNLERLAFHVNDDDINDLTSIHVRNDRMPRDSSMGQHKLFNMFIKRVGLVANRSNSIFVVGSKGTSKDFGLYVNCFFPIGDFNYTWNLYYIDLTNDLTVADVIDTNLPKNHGDFVKNELDKMVKNDNYISNYIKMANYKDVMNSFVGDDGSLYKALDTKHEVMIHPVSGYGYMLGRKEALILQMLMNGSNDKAAIQEIIRLY